jgi:S-disulfanyl-L-cysteine oxidoreductase SoxD
VKALQIKIGIAAVVGFGAIGATHSAPRVPQSAQTTRSVWDGVYTTDQEKRGAEQYANNCSRCHGQDLLGIGEAAPLTGPGFLANWDGLTLGDLDERIFRSMPQDKPGTLTREQVADIMTHILSFDGFPAGKTELDSKVEVLNQIRFDAQKPKPKSDSDSHEK